MEASHMLAISGHSYKTILPSTVWKFLSRTVAVTDSEIKGSVPFWDLLRACYSWLTYLSISLKCHAASLQCSDCLCTAVVTSVIWHKPSEFSTCKNASVKILLKVWEKWMLAASLSFTSLNTSFYLCPRASQLEKKRSNNFCCIFQSKTRVSKEQFTSCRKQEKPVFPNPKDEKVH